MSRLQDLIEKTNRGNKIEDYIAGDWTAEALITTQKAS